MHKCKVCQMEISKENSCSCNPELCAIHCNCAPECQCGCQEKKEKIQNTDNKKEENN